MTSGQPPNQVPPKAGPRVYDSMFDPLPQPDVVESDSETAWGRWEDSLQPESEPNQPDFEDTQPIDPADLEALNKSLRP